MTDITGFFGEIFHKVGAHPTIDIICVVKELYQLSYNDKRLNNRYSKFLKNLDKDDMVHFRLFTNIPDKLGKQYEFQIDNLTKNISISGQMQYFIKIWSYIKKIEEI